MKVCIVCIGNICRSPMAEVVLRAELAEIGVDVEVDSAGAATGHAGHPMDERALKALTDRGYDGSGHMARQFEASWERDLILVADNRTGELLEQMGKTDRVYLFGNREIPDPYFGDAGDFSYALDLIEAATPGVATRISDMLIK